MKIKLYYRLNFESTKEELKAIDVFIKGKMAILFEKPDQNEMPLSPPEKLFYDCKYDSSYKKEFDNLKLNYKFKFYNLCESEFGKPNISKGYTPLVRSCAAHTVNQQINF